MSNELWGAFLMMRVAPEHVFIVEDAVVARLRPVDEDIWLNGISHNRILEA